MNILFVEIENAGTGTDSSIGLFSGTLKWSSSGYGGYSSGIIDQKTVSRVISAMNITRGGGFGGFQGTVSVGAYSKELVAAVISKTISLIGKNLKIKIQISEDGDETLYESQRFICPITSYRISNEGLITIDCDTSKAFDRKKIGGITVTKEMALNDEKNEAIGKSVVNPIGGDITDFPAIYVSTENIPLSISVLASSTEMDVASSKLGSFNTLYGNSSSESNQLKGVSFFTSFKVYKGNDDASNIKIAPSFNGLRMMPGPYNDASVSLIRRIYLGLRFKCFKGVGEGKIFTIVGISYETLDSCQSLWFEISSKDETEISSFNAASGFIGFDTGLYFTESVYADQFSQAFRTLSNEDGLLTEDISYFSFIGSSNIFIIHGSIDLTNGCSIIGKSENELVDFEIKINTDSISILYSSPEWKMIQISSDGIIIGDDSSFWFRSLSKIRSQTHNTTPVPSLSGSSVNMMGFTKYDNSGEFEIDGKSDGYQIDSDETGNYGNTFSISYFGAIQRTLWSNLIFIPIEDFINGIDVSKGDANVLILPSFYFKFKTIRDLQTGGEWNINLLMNAWVVGEGNTILSQYCKNIRYEKTLTYQTSSSPSPLIFNEFTLFFDPENSAMKITENSSGLSLDEYYDYEGFNAVASALNISENLKAMNSKQIRGVLIQPRMWISSAMVVNGIINDTQMSKHIYASYIGYSKKINKDDILLRAKRNNGIDVVNTPISITKKILRENSVAIDLTSFNSVSTVHEGLYFDISSSTSQVHLDSKDSFSGVLNDIGKSSHTAIFQEGDGKIYAKWFADDDSDTATVHTFNDIISGSLSIDKPSGGFICTDFDFEIKKSATSQSQMVFVNTDEFINEFPESGVYDLYGSEIRNGSNGFSIENNIAYDVVNIHIRKNTSIITIIRMFTVGSYWRIEGHYFSDPTTPLYAYGVITSIAPTFKYGTVGVMIGFSNLTTSFGDEFYIDAIQLASPNEKWRDYVSGSFVTDYTTAKNIWEHAQNARVAVGVESKMSSEYTTLKQPVWGDDYLAIMNWILYTVIHNTREKTVITFRHKMTPQTILLKKMDYVKFQFGPYASINGIAQAGVKGWICEIEEDFSKMEFTFTILTSVSDTDALIIDERLADGSILIDENPVSTTFYDEGRLA